MTNRYFYQADIATFLAEETNSIFGKMLRADELDTTRSQEYTNIPWSQTRQTNHLSQLRHMERTDGVKRI